MSEVIMSQQRPLSRQTVAAEEMVSRVERALLTEVRLTPKPGLVDIRNAGAHRDMDLASFEASTAVVAPWMEKFFSLWATNTANIMPEQVLTMLRPVGMACETDMLAATGGVNTHRGAIFALAYSARRREGWWPEGSQLSSIGFAIRWPALPGAWSGEPPLPEGKKVSKGEGISCATGYPAHGAKRKAAFALCAPRRCRYSIALWRRPAIPIWRYCRPCCT